MSITLQELKTKFDLQYDNLLSGAAPGINDYEKSLLLTQGFREIIYNSYSGNTKGESVDDTERMKSLLSPLTKSIELTSTSFSESPKLTPNLVYTQVSLPSNVGFLLKESIMQSASHILVKPIKHDEFWVLVENPFKTPNQFRAWRLDESNSDTGKREIIIVSEKPIQKYTCTFIEKQLPIVLSNLGSIMSGLVIEGKTSATLPKVIAQNPWLADLVVNRAVELGTKAYKENSLNSQLALNTRIE